MLNLLLFQFGSHCLTYLSTFFDKGLLFSIARLIGEPLKVDTATVTLSRPSVARFYVEVNLLQDLPNKSGLGMVLGIGFGQIVKHENLAQYCSSCNKLGHATVSC